MWRFFNKTLLLVIVTTLILSTLGSTSLNLSASAEKNNIDQQALEQEIKMELEFYFDRIGEFDENGNYVIKDEELLKKQIESGDEIATQLYELSKLNHSEPLVGINGASEFATCVVNKFANSYGTIARQFATGAIYTYIKNKQYDLAAQLMAKTLIKAGFKVNAASLAIEAAVYGWQCRGKW